MVLATLQEAGFTVDAVLDDDPAKWNGVVCGVPVTGGTDILKKLAGVRALVAVGDNGRRRELVARCEGLCAWITAVHPRAYVHNSVRIGQGTVVFAGACIQPDTVIGGHVIVNTGATVDHDPDRELRSYRARHLFGRRRADRGGCLPGANRL